MNSDAIAFQGEHGAFSEKAVRQFFGDRVKASPVPSFREVFERVVSGECAYGIVPVENTLGGSIHQNWDLLMEQSVEIVGETKLRIVHCLIVNRGTRMDQVKRIYTHPQAALQCEKFLRAHPSWTVLQVYDTSGSVKMIKEEKALDAAAIASADAARQFDMEVLKEGVESDPQNYTRFLVIAKEPAKQGGKVSLVYATENKPGALFRTLEIFEQRGINLSKLEPRPIAGKPWEYLFYADLYSDPGGKSIPPALKELRARTTFLRILGTYPSAEEMMIANPVRRTGEA